MPKEGFLKLTAVLLVAAILAPQFLLFVPLHEVRAVGSGSVVENLRVIELPSDTNFWMRYLLEPLARALVRAMIFAVTQQIVSWIQGGGGKNVGYTGNFEQTLRRELNASGGEFLNQLTGINLCGNINAFLQISLRTPGLRQRLECTVTDIVQNVQNHFRNFQNGGWPAFIRISLQPQNNPYGAYFIALDAKIAAESSRAQSIYAGASWGAGFLGFRVPKQVCDDVSSEVSELDTGPNNTLQQEGSNSTSEQVRNAGSGQQQLCHTEYDTKTPGRLIADSLSKATNSGIDFAISAKWFDEAISIIITAVLNKVISSSFGSNGQGIFDSGVTSIPFSTSQNSVQFIARVNDGLRNTEALLQDVDSKRVALYQDLFAKKRELRAAQLSGDTARVAELTQKISDINAEIARLESKKQEIAAVKTELLQIKQQMLSTTDPRTMSTLAARAAQLNADLVRLGGELNITIDLTRFGGASTGDAREDTITSIQNTVDFINNEVRVADTVADELSGVASSTSSGTTKSSAESARDTILGRATLLQSTRSKLQTLQQNLRLATSGTEIDRLITQSITLSQEADTRTQSLDDAIKAGRQLLLSS